MVFMCFEAKITEKSINMQAFCLFFILVVMQTFSYMPQFNSYIL